MTPKLTPIPEMVYVSSDGRIVTIGRDSEGRLWFKWIECRHYPSLMGREDTYYSPVLPEMWRQDETYIVEQLLKEYE